MEIKIINLKIKIEKYEDLYFIFYENYFVINNKKIFNKSKLTFPYDMLIQYKI